MNEGDWERWNYDFSETLYLCVEQVTTSKYNMGPKYFDLAVVGS